MTSNVELKKNKNENNLSVIKRFTRKVQESGVLQRVRSIRYLEREKSSNVRKAKRLVSLKKRETFDELVKLGKISSVRTKKRR
jgi:ribosomal protein S21